MDPSGKTQIIVCDPTYFNVVNIGQNPFMHGKIPVDKELAKKQWLDLIIHLGNCGAPVHFLGAKAGLHDQVFTHDQAFIFGERALLGNFSAKARIAETEIMRNHLEKMGIAIFETQHHFECEVGLDPSRKIAWFGYGIRSDKAAANDVQRLLGVNYEVHPLKLIDERFYHLDLALGILGNGSAIVYLPAFTPKSQKKIKSIYGNMLYQMSEDEALMFFANFVVVNNKTILMTSRPNTKLQNWIHKQGFQIWSSDFSEFFKSGGGIHCLLNQFF